jgi:SPP1 family phage portal protein
MTIMEELIRRIKRGAMTAMSMEDIIRLEITNWLSSPERDLMITGQKYYCGDSDILNRIRTVIGDGGQEIAISNLANNKLVHNFARKLVDQKIGYMLSKPLSIQTNNEIYQQTLNEILDKSFLRVLMNIGKEAINKGKAWLHIYYDANGRLSFKKIPSEEIIPLWQDAAHTELEAVIRIYDIEAYEGTQKTIIHKVEFWDANGVQRYVYDGGNLIPDVEAGEFTSHFIMIDDEGNEQGYNWERIPFICFKYNDEEIPLIKFVKSLIDDYDKQASDNSNNLEDLPNSIYVIKNYDGTDLGEFRRNLSVFRAVKVTDEGGVDTLSIDFNVDAFKTHMDMLRKDIYEFGRGVDTQSEKFGGDKSGVALKFLYADLDMDCNIIETEFQASLEQLRWFIDRHIANTTGQDFSDEVVDFIFNRDIIINETDAIQNARASVGLISDETIVANHPWVTNVQEELERIGKERQAGIYTYQEFGQNNAEADTA